MKHLFVVNPVAGKQKPEEKLRLINEAIDRTCIFWEVYGHFYLIADPFFCLFYGCFDRSSAYSAPCSQNFLFRPLQNDRSLQKQQHCGQIHFLHKLADEFHGIIVWNTYIKPCMYACTGLLFVCFLHT